MPFLQVCVSILGQKLVALSRGFVIVTPLYVCWLWRCPDPGCAGLQVLRVWCSSVVHVVLPLVEKHRSGTLVMKKNTITIHKFSLKKYFSNTDAVKALFHVV